MPQEAHHSLRPQVVHTGVSKPCSGTGASSKIKGACDSVRNMSRLAPYKAQGEDDHELHFKSLPAGVAGHGTDWNSRDEILEDKRKEAFLCIHTRNNLFWISGIFIVLADLCEPIFFKGSDHRIFFKGSDFCFSSIFQGIPNLRGKIRLSKR